MARIQEQTFDWDLNPQGSNQQETNQYNGYQRISGQVLRARSVSADDQRTDSKLRTVFFEPERIVILRAVAGVSMRIVVPIERFEDVRLKVKFTPAAPTYHVVLRHDDPDLCVSLFESDDLEFGQAALSEWANYFGLSKVEDVAVSSGENDSAEEMSCQMRHPSGENTTILNDPIGRRRGSTLKQRRPRLFSRRHMGDRGLMENVYRGSREIIARN